MGFLVVVLLLIVVIFGVSSTMQSYATAQQAQAQIETAKVAQAATWGNVMTIFAVVVLVLVVVAVIVALLWLRYRLAMIKVQQTKAARVSTETAQLAEPHSPELNADTLIKIMLVNELRALHRPVEPALPAPAEKQDVSHDDPLFWLK